MRVPEASLRAQATHLLRSSIELARAQFSRAAVLCWLRREELLHVSNLLANETRWREDAEAMTVRQAKALRDLRDRA